MIIVKKLYENSIKYPERLAIASCDSEITYEELWVYSNKFATYLKNEGLLKGDAVIIQGMQNVAFVVILFGVLLSGGVVVPVEKNIAKNNLDNIEKETNAKIKFTKDTLKDFNLAEILNLISDIDIKEHIFPSIDDISDILYTTGTTGASRGIIHTNQSHYATIENILNAIDMPDNNVTMIAAPLSHSFGLRRMYAKIVHGSSIVITDGVLDIGNFFKFIEKYNVLSIVTNPSMISIILQMIDIETLKKYSNNIIYFEFSGSVLPLNTVKTIKDIFPKSKIYNSYGSTEAGVMLGFDYASNMDKAGSIGTPNINSNIYILDDNMNVIDGYDKNNAGFLAIKSPIIMQGYLNDEVGTKEVLKDGYYVTRDIVYRDEDGFYYFIGRQSDIISIGGLKVSPSEIEDVVMKYTGIVECVCIGKDSDMAGQVPIIFITINENYNEKEIYSFLKGKLEPYKFPKEIHIINEIPKTFNGKVLRRKLREML